MDYLGKQIIDLKIFKRIGLSVPVTAITPIMKRSINWMAENPAAKVHSRT